jgi:hypothetical protein
VANLHILVENNYGAMQVAPFYINHLPSGFLANFAEIFTCAPLTTRDGSLKRKLSNINMIEGMLS